jgi:uncharacterized membrane protein
MYSGDQKLETFLFEFVPWFFLGFNEKIVIIIFSRFNYAWTSLMFLLNCIYNVNVSHDKRDSSLA